MNKRPQLRIVKEDDTIVRTDYAMTVILSTVHFSRTVLDTDRFVVLMAPDTQQLPAMVQHSANGWLTVGFDDALSMIDLIDSTYQKSTIAAYLVDGDTAHKCVFSTAIHPKDDA